MVIEQSMHTHQENSSPTQKLWQWLIGLAVSLTALVIALWNVNLSAMGQALQQANYWYLLPACGFLGIWLLTRALIWRTVLGQHLPYWRVFEAIMAGYLLSNVLPLRLGEVGRAYFISRPGDVKAGAALSAVLVERVLDMLWILGLAAAFLPLVVSLPTVQAAAIALAIVCFIALGSLTVIAHNRTAALRLINWTLCQAQRRLPLNAATWEKRLTPFLDGLAVLQDARRASQVLFWGAISWSASGLFAWMLLRSFVATATVPMGFFVLVMVGLGIAAPSLPGYVGVYEAAVVLALSLFKVEANTAATYAVLHHGLTFGVTCILGGIALSRSGESLTHLAGAARTLLLSRTANPPPPNNLSDNTSR